MTRKVSPSLKIIPKLIKLLYFLNFCFGISKFWYRLFLWPNLVHSKYRIKNFIKILICDITFFWNSIIKRQRWVKCFLFLWIWKKFIRFLNFEPNVVVKFLLWLWAFQRLLFFCQRTLLIRVVLKCEFSVCCFDLIFSRYNFVIFKS